MRPGLVLSQPPLVDVADGSLTVVEAAPIAPLLVGVQVDPASLARGAPDEVQPRVQLAQLYAEPTQSESVRTRYESSEAQQWLSQIHPTTAKGW